MNERLDRSWPLIPGENKLEREDFGEWEPKIILGENLFIGWGLGEPFKREKIDAYFLNHEKIIFYRLLDRLVWLKNDDDESAVCKKRRFYKTSKNDVLFLLYFHD